MTYIRHQLAFISLALILSCNKRDDGVAIEPFIEFSDLRFVDVPDGALADTLVLRFYFRDGDLDIGRGPSEIDEPFHYRWYYKKSGEKITDAKFESSMSSVDELITFEYKRTLENDTLPAYGCKNWHKRYSEIGIPDTLYSHINKDCFDLFVDYYVQTGAGPWTYFDFEELGCGATYNGRLPLISKSISKQVSGPFLVQMTSPREGFFQYSMGSLGFKFFLGGKRLKLKVRITDRALHSSNEIETSEIQF